MNIFPEKKSVKKHLTTFSNSTNNHLYIVIIKIQMELLELYQMQSLDCVYSSEYCSSCKLPQLAIDHILPFLRVLLRALARLPSYTRLACCIVLFYPSEATLLFSVTYDSISKKLCFDFLFYAFLYYRMLKIIICP